MPNTLAHMAVQGALSEPVTRRDEAPWVLLGCVLPDVPWILHRVVRSVGVPDLYDLRLYAVVQSSLLWSLLLAGAVALLARRSVRASWILGLGCILHLLLDMAQTKWANGAVLLAPLSWDVVNLGWFWPESWVTVTLTILGLAYVGWAWVGYRGDGRPPLTFTWRRTTMAVGALVLYVVSPFAVLDGVEAADAHYVGSLKDRDERSGARVEFDRAKLVTEENGAYLVPFTGERIRLEGMEAVDSDVVSVRGTFRNDSTLFVRDWHGHRAFSRDLASVAGIVLILVFWARAGLESHR